MNVTVKNAGGPYWNKNRECFWVELHDGTTHKFIIQREEDASPQAPKDWTIGSAEMISAMTKELIAGEPITDVQAKYGPPRKAPNPTPPGPR